MPDNESPKFVAARESAFGTKRTWPDVRAMSAFGGKADIALADVRTSAIMMAKQEPLR